MNYLLDLFLVLIVLLEVIICYFKGFAKSAWKLISTAASTVLAYFFGPSAGRFLLLKFWESKVDDQSKAELFSDICGYLIVFSIALVALSLIGIAVKKASKTEALSTLDAILGAVFGAVIGILIDSAICVLIALFVELKLSGDAADWVRSIASDSYIFRFFCDFAPFEYISIDKLLGILGKSAESIKN